MPLQTNGKGKGRFIRPVIVGIILIPINLYWVMQAETIYRLVFSTLFTLFYNVTFSRFCPGVVQRPAQEVCAKYCLPPKRTPDYLCNAVHCNGNLWARSDAGDDTESHRLLVRHTRESMVGPFWKTSVELVECGR